jgi:preprotein translocase subunit SecB
MAEDGNGGGGAGGAAAEGSQPSLGVVTQYVKDLSFEHPGAPATMQSRAASPNINIAIGVQSNPLAGGDVEVELRIEARAVADETVLFAVELNYAGIFRLTNVPAEQLRPLTLIECPRLLFPFARQVVAEATRNGGFPPLLIDPVDFVALYRKRMAQEGAQPQAGPGPGTPPQ